jgi:3-isopropylmalate dehydrogenase
MQANIILLPGDGIGPEVIVEARATLETISSLYDHNFHFHEHPIGGIAIDERGDPLPPDVLEACRSTDAVLLGSVGGPKWDDPLAEMRPEQGLLRLRYGLGLYANLRPIKVYPGLRDSSPVRAEKLTDVDFLIVRELTGGIYFGQPSERVKGEGEIRAVDTMAYTESEIRRVLRLAFQLATSRRGRVTLVDKANVLETSRLWREVAQGVDKEFVDIELEFQLVDSAAMRIITSASSFDVLVTANMFGDILSDEAAVLTGSLGMLPSAALGDGSLGLYEPVHGSAPDIAGKGVANPIGAILSAAMLLRHSFKLTEEAKSVEAAVEGAIEDGARTVDLGGDLSTGQMGREIRSRLGIRSKSKTAIGKEMLYDEI